MKFRVMATVAMVVLATCGCTDKKQNNREPQMEVKKAEAVADSMRYGVCGIGTSMNTVELIDKDGKSLSFTLNNGDAQGNVLGGLDAGDSIAVLSRTTVDGMPFADIVVNITTLSDRWVSLNKSLTLYKEGKALTKATEGEPMVSWRLCNGNLVIGKDTFAISSLGPDSLYLVKGKSVTGYRRMKNK